MSGTVFQGEVFDLGAFEVAHQAVAVALNVAAPVLGRPQITTVLTATPLVVTPVLGTPVVHQANALLPLALTAALPVLARPGLGQHHYLAGGQVLAVALPVLATPALGQHHYFAVHELDTGQPVLARPGLGQNFHLAAAALTGQLPVLASTAHVAIVGHTLHGQPITLGAPHLGLPLLGQEKAVSPFQHLFKAQFTEAQAVLQVLADKLLLTSGSSTGEAGSVLRRRVGDMLSMSSELVLTNQLGTAMQACFSASMDISPTLQRMDDVRAAMQELQPTGDLGRAIANSALVMALACDARILAGVTFESQDDVQAMLERMTATFDQARVHAADEFASASYQAVVDVAAAVARHLAATALQLPRVVRVGTRQSMPASAVANLVYADGSRWEELVRDNHVIHPAFMPAELRALSQ